VGGAAAELSTLRAKLLGHCGGARISASDYTWPDAIRAAVTCHDAVRRHRRPPRRREHRHRIPDLPAKKAGQGGGTTIVVSCSGTDWYMLAISKERAPSSTPPDNLPQLRSVNSVNDFLGANALRFLGADDANQNAGT